MRAMPQRKADLEDLQHSCIGLYYTGTRRLIILLDEQLDRSTPTVGSYK